MSAMILRALLALAVLLLPLPALAQSIEGHWALRIDDATIFVFRLDQTGANSWTGAWKRPAEITSNGAVFRAMSGSEVVAAVEAVQRGEELHLTFSSPTGDTRRDVLRFRLVGTDQAQFSYQGLGSDPYPLIRVLPDTPLGPFVEGRIYDRDLAVVEADYRPPAAEPAPEESPQSVELEVEEEATVSDAEPEADRIDTDFLTDLPEG